MIQIYQEIKVVNLDHKPAKRCSDYESDCVDVKNPFVCWVGDELCGPADGYCPLIFTNENN